MNCESKGFRFEDVLLLIGLSARTGELVLESGNSIGSIIFHNGTILQAFSPYSRAIGDLLVEDGVISEIELLETLQLQRKNSNLPIGCLFLKSGKVSFEVIELMVHEQIRKAVKDFSSWPHLRASFADRDLMPFDKIHLPVHEFIAPETLKSATNFFSDNHNLKQTSSTPASIARI